MKLGAYTACLHDKPLPEALAILAELGLTSAEINSGGFLPPVHLPIADIRSSETARSEYLGLFAEHGITLTALNCNGNPLHPDAAVRDKHGQDVRDAVELAALLGVPRVITMSGLPGTNATGTKPAWAALPWESSGLDVRDYQWNEVAVPYWRDLQARAADADVHVGLELHPHNVVYNARTMLRLAEEIDATHIGAELDPSHLFWQGMEPVAVIGALGSLVKIAAAKDIRVNANAAVNGVLDDGFARVPVGSPGAIPLGGDYTLSEWPKDSSWDFVAVGRGHDVDYWTRFLAALAEVDPDMTVNIEHEDQELDQIGGLRSAAEVMLAAADRV
ncbi:sugar phosphate isomerase/epimerase family protein [Pseudonocardia pini]|uniref:sugar phosphate isomerase/epimerase family protein n=1 Tax=Pseudonocardia pini TaxID=2758030 RepID=UPI0015F07566|nr:sugar phosphate isomerase/epimerase [Pseudonocardia pini]